MPPRALGRDAPCAGAHCVPRIEEPCTAGAEPLAIGALVATRHDAAIHTFYQRLVAAGKPKTLALTACMRKLLIILNAIIKTNAR
jgi:hypothetical protein